MDCQSAEAWGERISRAPPSLALTWDYVILGVEGVEGRHFHSNFFQVIIVSVLNDCKGHFYERLSLKFISSVGVKEESPTERITAVAVSSSHKLQ